MMKSFYTSVIVMVTARFPDVEKEIVFIVRIQGT